jgi:ParB family chromosome partitioning protein
MPSHSRSTLGRGLASLIPDARPDGLLGPRAALAGGAVVHIPLDEVRPNPHQPRRWFNPAAMEELTASVREKGVVSPILLRPIERGYEIVAGERRFRAARQAGLRTVPAIIRKMTRTESLEIALIENLQREDLSPIEEAEAYQKLMKEFEYTQEELARKVGKDRSTVSNMVRLLRLPDEVLEALSRGRITMGHGRALLGLKKEAAILQIFGRLVTEGLSVRQTEELVRRTVEGKATRRRRGKLDEVMHDLQDRMARRLGSRVMLKPRARGDGGKIVVEYFSRQELDRIVDRIADA